MKLQIKVPLLVVLIILLTGSVSVGVLLYSQRQASLKEFQQTGQTVARVIQSSLEQYMLLGNRQHVQSALVSIAGREFVTKAALLLPDGTIAASSELDEIGKADYATKLPGGLLTNESLMRLEGQDSGSSFYTITPLLNEPACQNCHNSDIKVLGAIKVSLNTGSLNEHLREEAILIVLSGLLTFILVGGGLALMLRRTMLARLSVLAKTAQRLSKGDYAARSTITAKDEIGVLASTFNEMAGSVEQRNRELEDSRRQLARWNTDLEDRVQRRTRELSAMNTVLGTLSQSLDPNKMLKDALNDVLKLLQVEAGVIYLADGNSRRLVSTVELGLSSNNVPETCRLRIEKLASEVTQSGRTAEFNSASGKVECGEFRSLVGIPVRSKTILGVLMLASFSTDKFEPETLRLLLAMCDTIGIALENAKAAQSIEEANKVREQLLEKLISAQEEERRRIARELHDEASQSLAALAINLEDVADTLPMRYKTARERLAVLKERAVTTLSGIRSLALELRPSALDDLGLSAAIDWYAKDYLKKRGLDIKVQIVGQKAKLPSYTETMLFRIAQESLANIVRHAEATRVDVELRFTASKVALQVTDNGKGFNVETALGRDGMRQNLGIHGMMERTTLLSGTLAIHSKPGQGTTLLVEVPLGRENGHHDENKDLSG